MTYVADILSILEMREYRLFHWIRVLQENVDLTCGPQFLTGVRENFIGREKFVQILEDELVQSEGKFLFMKKKV